MSSPDSDSAIGDARRVVVCWVLSPRALPALSDDPGRGAAPDSRRCGVLFEAELDAGDAAVPGEQARRRIMCSRSSPAQVGALAAAARGSGRRVGRLDGDTCR
jgi:hypothetical protein